MNGASRRNPAIETSEQIIRLLVCILFTMTKLATLFLLLPAALSLAQPARIHKEYSQAVYQGMKYGWFRPSNLDEKKKYPLVVYLHGAGDTVSRNNYWYQPSIQKENPVFVLAPKCVNSNQGWGNTWNESHTPDMRKTLE